MPVPNRNKQPKRKYAKISLKKRQTLVELVLNQGKGLTKTSKKLNLKLSTAKLILRKYRQTGQFHVRKIRQKSTPTEPAAISSQENEAVISADEYPQKNNYEMSQNLDNSQNIYPVMYGQAFYPFFNYYGIWNLENYYQYL